MKLSIGHTKNNTYLYMVKSFRKNGKSTSKIVEKLGTLEEVKQQIEKGNTSGYYPKWEIKEDNSRKSKFL